MPDGVLLVTFAFPPTAAPEAFLGAKRLGALPHHAVDVVCAAAPPSWNEGRDTSLDDYVAQRFRTVVRVPPATGLTRAPRAARLLVPDPYRAFVRPAVRAALALAEEAEYAAVVTWSQWHSAHLAGLELKRRLGLPWLAHLSDPWLDNPFEPLGGLRRRRSAALERRVFCSADRLLFTSEHAIDVSTRRYPPSWRAKATALPHAYDRSLYDDADPAAGDRIVVRYVGAFYGRRTPDPLLRALGDVLRQDPALASRLRVEVVGFVQDGIVDADALAALPEGVFLVVPPVPYVDSLRLMRESHGLVLVDAPAARSPFLPSKLIDYIGAGRPIAALTPPGPAADVTRAIGGFVADPGDANACADALRLLVGAAASGRPFGDPAVRARYDVTEVGAAMDELVRDASAA